MAHIPADFLDDLRERLSVSEVVARRVTLKRKGSEYVGLSPFNKENTPSFTVNDSKKFWHDFSSGKHGDIFGFEMETTGCTFTAAVETLASLAGLQIPGGPRAGGRADRRPSRKPNGDGAHSARIEPREVDEPPADDFRGAEVPGRPGGADAVRRIAARHAYHDADGAPVYEVVKLEWADERGRHKVALPRRPVPGEPDRWVWGLKAGTYVRGRDGDFRQLTEARESWPGERRAFDETAPMLYRLPELREEMAQDADERRIVFAPEGEKDADTLAAWGCCATTSPGGTAGWRAWFPLMLQGADVVIPLDNDEAGRKFAHEKALSLRGIAARVRLLDFRDHWPGCPDKADVSDWRDHAGGTADKLFEIVDRLKDWTPEPPDSKFRAIPWERLDAPGEELEPLIKNVLTRGEVSMWYGAHSSGKTFLFLDACLSIARGNSWFGNRVKQGLVIYQAGEKYRGLKRRLRAYRKYHRLIDAVPFILLPARINLWVDDKHTRELIDEANAWKAFYEDSLELIVIDTMSAASTGANENASEDIGRVLQRCHDVAVATGAHVALVHHVPKTGGSPRGWSGMSGNVETLVEVLETDQCEDGFAESGASVKRTVRQFVTRKQSDGEAQMTWSFVLHAVEVGRDPVDGAAITSCVVLPSGSQVEADRRRNVVPPGYYDLNPGGRAPNNVAIFQILCRAIGELGRVPQESDEVRGVPALGLGAIKIEEWRAAAERAKRGTEASDAKTAEAVRKAIKRGIDKWTEAGVVGVDNGWIWRTTRRVAGIDPPPPAARAMEPERRLLAPGETEDDIAF